MIRFTLAKEPAYFDEKVRQPGRRWLKKHPDRTSGFPRKWTECEDDLRKAFRGLCAYCAMWISEGHVDHYMCKTKKKNRALIYEWKNYRYSLPTINRLKDTLDDNILDPFQVKDDWFEVRLDTLQVELTKRMPNTHRRRAKFTFEKLGLNTKRKITRLREHWYKQYQEHVNDPGIVDIIRKHAPMIARAIEKLGTP